jgi:hypothetical protein
MESFILATVIIVAIFSGSFLVFYQMIDRRFRRDRLEERQIVYHHHHVREEDLEQRLKKFEGDGDDEP